MVVFVIIESEFFVVNIFFLNVVDIESDVVVVGFCVYFLDLWIGCFFVGFLYILVDCFLYCGCFLYKSIL